MPEHDDGQIDDEDRPDALHGPSTRHSYGVLAPRPAGRGGDPPAGPRPGQEERVAAQPHLRVPAPDLHRLDLAAADRQSARSPPRRRPPRPRRAPRGVAGASRSHRACGIVPGPRTSPPPARPRRRCMLAAPAQPAAAATAGAAASPVPPCRGPSRRSFSGVASVRRRPTRRESAAKRSSPGRAPAPQAVLVGAGLRGSAGCAPNRRRPAPSCGQLTGFLDLAAGDDAAEDRRAHPRAARPAASAVVAHPRRPAQPPRPGRGLLVPGPLRGPAGRRALGRHDWDADPDYEFRTAAELEPEELRRRYREACARSREVVAAAESLDQLSVGTSPQRARTSTCAGCCCT